MKARKRLLEEQKNADMALSGLLGNMTINKDGVTEGGDSYSIPIEGTPVDRQDSLSSIPSEDTVGRNTSNNNSSSSSPADKMAAAEVSERPSLPSSLLNSKPGPNDRPVEGGTPV